MIAPGPGYAAPDPALVARFRGALDRLWPQGGWSDNRLGLAVSGGPDSLAMLLLAEAAIPEQFEVATVDHGLRPGAALECDRVAQACAARGIPCAVLSVELAAGNLQAAARDARYAALAQWAEDRDLSAVATAHHGDDQAETMVMRLNRGSGVRGLAGIRARTSLPGAPLPLIRPLLAFRHAELIAVVTAAGLEATDDPSNHDDRFDRSRIRKALRAADWIDPAGWGQSAAHLAEMEQLLAFMIGREWTECAEWSGDEVRYAALRTGIPGVNAVRIGVVESAARALGCGPLTTGAAAKMVEALIAGQAHNAGGMLGRTIDREGERLWLFRAEPSRREA